MDEAAAMLDIPAAVAEQTLRDSFTLIEVLVASAVASIARERAAPLLETMGRAAEAEHMRGEMSALLGPFEAWKERRQNDGDVAERLVRRAGILHRLLLPAVGEPITDDELTTGRLLEHTGPRATLAGPFLATFLLLMLACGVMALFRRVSLLLLPGRTEALRVILLSVVAPLSVFLVYTRYSGLAGRRVRAVLALAALRGGAASACPRHAGCRLRVDRPSSGSPVPRAGAPGAAAARRFLALVAVLPLGILVWLLTGWERFGDFKATVARSLVPVFAAVVLITSVAVHPYLAAREAALVRTDPVLAVTPESMGFTRIEARLVKRLKTESLNALERYRDAHP